MQNKEINGSQSHKSDENFEPVMFNGKDLLSLPGSTAAKFALSLREMLISDADCQAYRLSLRKNVKSGRPPYPAELADDIALLKGEQVL